MATFKTTIKKEKMRADKTWLVLIRFSHSGESRYIPTTMYVTKKDLTASWKIKNTEILDRCDYLIQEYKKKMYKLNMEINNVGI